jgi:hypothetical protein
MPTDTQYRDAQEHVRARRGLYMHAAIYAIVNIALFLIDALTPGGWWFFWPLCGWGAGLAINALAVFGGERWLGGAWERREIERYVRHHPGG